MSLTFRPIRPDDREFLRHLYASTRLNELAPVPWTDTEKMDFLRQQFEAQHTYYQQQWPDADYEIILQNGQPIGRLYVHRRADEFRLIDIALLPAYRNQGLGTALMEDLLDEAREAGLPVRIHVEQFNPALRLYQRLGFHTLEDRGVYLFMEWSPERNNDAG